MKTHSSFLLLALICLPVAARAQVILSFDVNDRTASTAADNLAGFDPVVIGAVGTTGLIQTNPTVLAFGPMTVTLSGSGTDPGYDDRRRAVPADSPAVTQAPLYRDFIFSRDTNSGGLNITIDGLTPDQIYKVTIWSYDNSTTGGRTSDWYANGTLRIAGYFFNGSTVPTSDAQYRFNFVAPASAGGQLAIEGRRVGPPLAGNFSVFLNALRVEIAPPDPPSLVTQPQSQTVFAGDHAWLSTLAAGTPPLSVQWYLADNTPIEDATNNVLSIFNSSAGNAGGYYVVAYGPNGPSATSQVATLTVLPVANIASGLLAHWSLDAFNPGDPAVLDQSPYANDLALAAMDVSNIDLGRHGTSLLFNGVDEYLIRTNDFASLPAYQYPAYSVALWVKGNGVGQADRRVWAESSNTNNTPIVDIGTVPGGTNGAVDIFIRNTSGGGGINHRTTSLIAFDGNWHHIAWVDNNGYGRVYVDGVQDANDFTYTRGVLVADATCLGGVARTNGALALFTGNIDDVHVWRRSLTQDEVRTVMDRVRVLSINPGGPNTVISYVTATPAAAHRVQEKTNIEDAWADTAGVVIANTGPSTYSATFPAAGGGQKFYRVVSP